AAQLRQPAAGARADRGGPRRPAGHRRRAAQSAAARSADARRVGIPAGGVVLVGVMAPAGTPADIVETLNRHIDAVLADPEVREYFVQQGMQPMGGAPGEFGRHIVEETRKWRAAVEQAGVRVTQ